MANKNKAPLAATGRTSDPNVANVTTGMPWEDSLAHFQTPQGYNDWFSEIARVDNLISSGQAPDMAAAQKWRNQLNAIAPIVIQNAPTSTPTTTAQVGTQPINQNNYRTELATIEDLSRKYGFDYSKEYAQRQAELEAQAKRNAYLQGLRENEAFSQRNLAGIEQGLRSALDALDVDRFLAQQDVRQNQALTGVNAGIAADQDLRLAMSAQNVMGDIYGQANLGRMDERQRFTNEALRLMEGLALTEQEKIAYAEQLYNDRLQQAFQNIMTEGSFRQNENLAMLQAALAERGQNINIDQFNRSFDWARMMDEIGLTGRLPDSMGGGYSVQEEQRRFQNDWMNILNNANLTGYLPSGAPTVQEQQRQFQNLLAERQFNRPYEELTAMQKAQLDQQATQFESSMNKAQTLFDLPSVHFETMVQAYRSATPAQQAEMLKKFPELEWMLGVFDEETEFDPIDVEMFMLEAKEALGNFKNVTNAEIRNWLLQNRDAAWSSDDFESFYDMLIEAAKTVRAANRKPSKSSESLLPPSPLDHAADWFKQYMADPIIERLLAPTPAPEYPMSFFDRVLDSFGLYQAPPPRPSDVGVYEWNAYLRSDDYKRGVDYYDWLSDPRNQPSFGSFGAVR